MIISRRSFGMRSVSEKKNCRENENTHFLINNFFHEKDTVYEIMWKSMVDKSQMTI